MACEYCLRDFGHPSSCPNYIPLKPNYYCSICDEGIQNGEEYITNDENEYAHWDCFDDTNDLLKWLGYKVEIMEDDDY